MALSNPSVDDFKNFFSRDFPYGTDPKKGVTDQDISNAFILTNAGINPALFGVQSVYTPAYLQLAAHYLVTSLRASAQGLGGSFTFLTASKSVGSVSQSFSIPDRIAQNPYWAALMGTSYGAMYLVAIMPYLTGQVFCVAGTTQP